MALKEFLARQQGKQEPHFGNLFHADTGLLLASYNVLRDMARMVAIASPPLDLLLGELRTQLTLVALGLQSVNILWDSNYPLAAKIIMVAGLSALAIANIILWTYAFTSPEVLFHVTGIQQLFIVYHRVNKYRESLVAYDTWKNSGTPELDGENLISHWDALKEAWALKDESKITTARADFEGALEIYCQDANLMRNLSYHQVVNQALGVLFILIRSILVLISFMLPSLLVPCLIVSLATTLGDLARNVISHLETARAKEHYSREKNAWVGFLDALDTSPEGQDNEKRKSCLHTFFNKRGGSESEFPTANHPEPCVAGK